MVSSLNKWLFERRVMAWTIFVTVRLFHSMPSGIRSLPRLDEGSGYQAQWSFNQ
jgi:hypothetical protein